MNPNDPFNSHEIDKTVILPSPGKRPSPISRTTPEPIESLGIHNVSLSDIDLSIKGSGINPLVAAANPLLNIATIVRSIIQFSDLNGLHDFLVEKIKSFENTARDAKLSPEKIIATRYALCTFLDESIASMKDLKGATIGVATLGSPQDQQLEILLRGDGLRRDDVSVVAYGNGPAAIASLQFEKVDAGMINGSAFNVLKRRAPEVRALVDPRTREATAQLTGVERWPNFCLLARVAWLDQNPAVAQRLVNAITRALGWTHAHTAEELRDRLPASLRTEDAECDLETLRILIAATSKDGRMASEAPAGLLRYMAPANEQLRNAKIDLAATYTNQFVEAAAR